MSMLNKNKQPSKKKVPKKVWMMTGTALFLIVGLGLWVRLTLDTPAPQSSEQKLIAEQLESLDGLEYYESDLANLSIPSGFTYKGRLGDGISVAVNENTGEVLVFDTSSGQGTITTSVEGLMGFAYEDMKKLDQLAEARRRSMSPQAYNWLKKVSQTGQQLTCPPGENCHEALTMANGELAQGEAGAGELGSSAPLGRFNTQELKRHGQNPSPEDYSSSTNGIPDLKRRKTPGGDSNNPMGDLLSSQPDLGSPELNSQVDSLTRRAESVSKNQGLFGRSSSNGKLAGKGSDIGPNFDTNFSLNRGSNGSASEASVDNLFDAVAGKGTGSSSSSSNRSGMNSNISATPTFGGNMH